MRNMESSGEPYKGDVLTPVFSWKKTAYTSVQLVCLLSEDYDLVQTCISQPINVSHNASFLVDVDSLEHHDDLKCDDMGVWKHNGSPKRFYSIVKDSQEIKHIYPVDKEASKVSDDNIYELRRTYYKNASDKNVRKIVSKLIDNRGQQRRYILVQYLFSGEEHEVKRILPHGNAKSNSSYTRLFPSMREKLKQSVLDNEKTAKETLDDVYRSSGDVTMARSLGELPRGPNDLYNARHSAKQSRDSGLSRSEGCRAGNSNTSVSLDSVWTLLERAKREEEESKESVFIRECTIHPDLFVVLANDRQLQELVQFCTHQMAFSILGIDPTFNIFDRNISLTVTTYRNLKLENPNTGKPPVFIGPLLMHQRKDWKTYSKFAHSLTTAKPELEGVLACGTDGELALINGFKRNMRFAVFLRCFLHFKENIKRELTVRGFSSDVKKQFLAEIFGKQEGGTKYYGLVDCDSEDDFDTKLENLKGEWEERETGDIRKTKTFYEWFNNEKVVAIKESMLKSVRIEAGLGNPPSDYTNNDPEAANFIIKHGLHFNPQKPHEFIDKIKDIIETQQRNEDRAVFGKGPYRVRKGFAHLAVDDRQRSQLNSHQRTNKLVSFQKAGMDDLVDLASDKPQSPGEESTTPHLSITAEACGITSIPQPILISMFEKASILLSSPGNIIVKPGADDGSYIVAGTSNKVHSVKPGKGGSLSCDRACINHSSKICEHVLVVAEVTKKLPEFVAWFKRTKRKPTMMDMVEQGGPKNAGKKPSKRKRSNAKAKPIDKYVDILDKIQSPLDDNMQASIMPSSAVISGSTHASSSAPTSYEHHFTASDISFLPPSAVRSNLTQPSTSASTSYEHPFTASEISFLPPSAVNSSSAQASTSTSYQHHPMASHFSSMPPSAVRSNLTQPYTSASTSYEHPFTAPDFSFLPPSAIRSSPARSRVSTSASTSYLAHSMDSHFSSIPQSAVRCSSTQASTSAPTSREHQFRATPFSSMPSPGVSCGWTVSNDSGINSTPEGPFLLKWVRGTSVSKCYGCGCDIQNPPLQCPDDLILVHRDLRVFRDRTTGQLQTSNSPQNVHFHLRIGCILKGRDTLPFTLVYLLLNQISPPIYSQNISNGCLRSLTGTEIT